MFWCAKSVKFHFRWGTKPRHQKQETGNDCDVNSGLQASRKTDFSVIFLLWANKFAKKWYNTVYEKMRKRQRNLFFARLGALNWRHNCSQSSVFGLAVLYHTGSEIWCFWYIKTREREIAMEKTFLLYLSVHWGDLIEQIKKKSVIYTLTASHVSLSIV